LDHSRPLPLLLIALGIATLANKKHHLVLSFGVYVAQSAVSCNFLLHIDIICYLKVISIEETFKKRPRTAETTDSQSILKRVTTGIAFKTHHEQ
jgi:hypothetical protein